MNMHMKGLARRLGTGRVRSVVVVAALGGTAVMGVAPNAQAGTGCTLGLCSTTVNDSAYGVTAYFNWCRGGDSTGDSTATEPKCAPDGARQKSQNLTARGGHTPYNEDWDAFRVDAGWCYKVKFVRTGQSDFTRTYNRRGTSALWVKVGDNADAHVLDQGTASCP
ncbi:hypothetical protein P1S61_17950 [Streptomyces sp. ME08-AFT2]|uniref:hypothetical protein n=1 Tax=Streptomyces sp. ME08-AFT2 TaxID=3028683 RepID=UPI0029A8198D|nr:hypothetical protein [Streptomyces sp. ME08-AFT2]MDX3310917.1 hypothetical protein [Streptomyces sp. ME08-AFT2]